MTIEQFEHATRLRTPHAFLTPTLIGANVVVFVVMIAAGVHPFNPEAAMLLDWGADYGPRTTNGEWWRLLTAMFVHAGVLHLAANMYGLLQVGMFVERLVGNVAFLAIYVVAGILASVCSLWVHPSIVSVGASGAIFGIYGLGLVTALGGMPTSALKMIIGEIKAPERERESPTTLGLSSPSRDVSSTPESEASAPVGQIPVIALRPLRIGAMTFILYNIAGGFGRPGIDNAAHFGGLAAGVICGWLVARDVTAAKPALREVGFLTLGAAAVSAGAILALGVINDLNAEMERQLVKLVDGVTTGQPAPGDIQLTMTLYFLKSREQRTFVPFVLTVTGAPASDSALYVRVVNPSAQPDPKTRKVEYPWDDIHFLTAAQVTASQGRLNRVFMAAPGTYDVYVAMKERLPEKAAKAATPKIGVLKTQVTVPDFWSGELMTSSVIVADKVNKLNAMPSPAAARERPFVFGAQELIPASDMVFTKGEQLVTFFQVYNAALNLRGKPDLLLEYNFHRKEAGSEKFFNRTAPQTVNEKMLPPTFDPAKFPVPGGVEVPLASFPEGEYRLEIKVTDIVSKKVVTRDVNFTVKAS